MNVQQALRQMTGAVFSIGGKVAPQSFSTMLMRIWFSPSKAKVSERAGAILSNAIVECDVIDGNKIYHYIWGEGDRTVLLVHGWSGNSGQMTALAESLLAAKFKVIAIDFPGHGQSNGKYSSVIHFERVIAHAKNRYGPFYAIVAHSLGAAAATYALSRGLGCKRAVFFGPVAKFTSVWSGLQKMLGISPSMIDLTVRRAEKWLQISFDDIEPTRLAPNLSTELLVIHDMYDRETPIADSEELVRIWPKARLVGTDKLGHTRILSDDAMVRRTVEFIRA